MPLVGLSPTRRPVGFGVVTRCDTEKPPPLLIDILVSFFKFCLVCLLRTKNQQFIYNKPTAYSMTHGALV